MGQKRWSVAVIEFECPHCGNEFRVPDESAGRDGWCRVCKRMVIVPNPDGSGMQWDDLSAEERVIRLDKLLQFAATKADKLKVLLKKYSVEGDKLVPAKPTLEDGAEHGGTDSAALSDELARVKQERDEAVVDRDTLRAKCEALQSRIDIPAQPGSGEPQEDYYLEKLMLEASLQSAEEKAASLQEEAATLRRALESAEKNRANLDEALRQAESSHQDTADASAEALKALEAECTSLRARLERDSTNAPDSHAVAALEEANAELESKLSAVTAERDALQTAYDETNVTLSGLRESFGLLETEAAEARARATTEAEEAERSSVAYERTVKELTARATTTESALEEAKAAMAALENDLGAVQETAEAERQRAAMEAENASGFEARLSEMERALESAQAERDQAQAETAAARAETDTYKAELETLRRQWSEAERSSKRGSSTRPLEEEIGRLQRDLGDARASRAAAELERRASDGKLRQLREQQAEREEVHTELKTQVDEMRAELESFRQKRADLDRQLASLREERDRAIEQVESLRRDLDTASRGATPPHGGGENWVFAETPTVERGAQERKDARRLEAANLPVKADTPARGWIEPEAVDKDMLDEEDAIVDSYMKFLGRS